MKTIKHASVGLMMKLSPSQLAILYSCFIHFSIDAAPSRSSRKVIIIIIIISVEEEVVVFVF